MYKLFLLNHPIFKLTDLIITINGLILRSEQAISSYHKAPQHTISINKEPNIFTEYFWCSTKSKTQWIIEIWNIQKHALGRLNKLWPSIQSWNKDARCINAKVFKRFRINKAMEFINNVNLTCNQHSNRKALFSESSCNWNLLSESYDMISLLFTGWNKQMWKLGTGFTIYGKWLLGSTSIIILFEWWTLNVQKNPLINDTI